MKKKKRHRGKTKSVANVAMLEMLKAYFGKQGYRVSSFVEENGMIVVRFPQGGPVGLNKGRYGQLSIQEIERSFLQ